ncbi:hypothetical protein AXF42_Ash017581 [Apostasia shenzhenica]|uniref:Uncharacterized protein n=1 Tax=Apostasia shenzhenica TaxID=1088818 RepID=A0A2I0A3B3_9ASPA|nr:hypothetical protein AXF42_Ash017581 [Apostasia shenzhenica]
MQVVSVHTAMLNCTGSAQTITSNNSNSRTCPLCVRQNAAISILQNSATCSKHSSPLHPQPNANQQASQPSLQKSVASLNQQQGNLL